MSRPRGIVSIAFTTPSSGKRGGGIITNGNPVVRVRALLVFGHRFPDQTDDGEQRKHQQLSVRAQTLPSAARFSSSQCLLRLGREKRHGVKSEREVGVCVCLLTLTLLERKKLFAYYCAVQREEGTTERACRVFFESSEEEKGKRPNNRDPLFAQKLCFFGEKVRHPILPFYPHFYAHKLSLFLSLPS